MPHLSTEYNTKDSIKELLWIKGALSLQIDLLVGEIIEAPQISDGFVSED